MSDSFFWCTFKLRP